MPNLSRTLKKALKNLFSRRAYLEVDELLTRKEKRQLSAFVAVIFFPIFIGAMIFLFN